MKSILKVSMKRLVAAAVMAAMICGVFLPGRLGNFAFAADGAEYSIGTRWDSSYSTGFKSDDLPFGVCLKDGFSLTNPGNRLSSRWSGAPFTVYRDSVKIIEAAYCVSQQTAIHHNMAYTEISFETLLKAPDLQYANEAALRWIVNHGFVGTLGGLPGSLVSAGINLDPADVQPYFDAYGLSYSDLTAQEAIQGTQGAIWHFADGVNIDDTAGSRYLNPDPIDNPFDNPRVLAFYEALVGLAGQAIAGGLDVTRPVSLDVSLNRATETFSDDGAYKTFGPYEVEANVANGEIINVSIVLSSNVPGVIFTSDEEGEEELAGNEINAASGAFYLRIPSDVTGDVSVTATATADVKLNYNEPVIFVTYDRSGNQDWTTSQAVIASVPAGTQITSYATESATIPEEVINGDPALRVTKTWVIEEGEELEPGDWAVFKIEVENYGYGPATDVEVTDTLGAFDDLCDDIEFSLDEDFATLLPHTADEDGYKVSFDVVEIGTTVVYVRVLIKEDLDFGEDEELIINNVALLASWDSEDEDSARVRKPKPTIVPEDPEEKEEVEEEEEEEEKEEEEEEEEIVVITPPGNYYTPPTRPAPVVEAAEENEEEPAQIDEISTEIEDEETPLAEAPEEELDMPEPVVPLGEFEPEPQLPQTGIEDAAGLWILGLCASLAGTGFLYVSINKRKSDSK